MIQLRLPMTLRQMSLKYLFICQSILVFIFSSCEQPMPTRDSFPATFEEAVLEHHAMSYDVNYHMKFFSGTDTNHLKAKVDIVRVESDTNFKGHLWIEQDTMIRFYDGKNSYLIYKNQSRIIRYPEGANYIFKGNLIGHVVDIYFLKPERISKGFKDTSIQVVLNRDEHGSIFVNYTFPNENGIYDGSKIIKFRTNDYSLEKMTYKTSLRSETQFNQWEVSNVRYDEVTSDSLKERMKFYLEEYSMEEYSPPKRDSLKIGELFPEFEAYRYSDGKQLDWSALNAQLYLIDFWYMDCPPCIDLIPVLNKMQDKYPSIDVIGLNPFDSTEKNLGRLPDFLEYNPMKYPSYFIDRKDVKTAKVFAYPTLFILDKERKVLGLKIGFGERSENYIDSLIQLNLN